jgi:hypothetical protein
MNQPLFILGYTKSLASKALEPRFECTSTPLLLLLSHFFIDLLSLFFDKLSSLFEEFFEILLRLFSIEPLLLLLIAIILVLLFLLLRLFRLSCEASPHRFGVWVPLAEGVISLALGRVTQNLVSGCQLLEFLLVDAIVTVWMVELR